jgi:hypothetical protein
MRGAMRLYGVVASHDVVLVCDEEGGLRYFQIDGQQIESLRKEHCFGKNAEGVNRTR